MLIKKRHPRHPGEADVTAESAWLARRRIIQGLGAGAALLSSGASAGFFDWVGGRKEVEMAERSPLAADAGGFKPDRPVTPEAKAITYNNFFEFGTDKDDPWKKSQDLQTEPWTLTVEGEVEKPATVDVWELINSAALEERIYRMRCVEAWSMVIPWIGLELGKFLERFRPTSRARYVAFQTLYDPEQMPGQNNPFVGGGIDYPYVEGLRMDEAAHPLTLLTLGVYGKTLPPQNGAPVRLVVPWKYGFKGIKSIVRIKLVEKMPPTSWNRLAPNEYGFYANVNPNVDHPRWSQASERFIGPGGALDVTRKPTLMFNGYEEEVAHLYKGMDLRKHF